MARITRKMLEEKAAKLNMDKKIVRVEQRNNYIAIDSSDGKICFDCGLSTREAYQYLCGMEVGINLLIEELKKQFVGYKRICE